MIESVNSTPPATFSIDLGRLSVVVLAGCIGIEIMFFLLDWGINHEQGSSIRAIRRMFNTAREDSIPSWFAITQTFVVALIAALHWALVRKTGGTAWRKSGWLLISLFFLYMAIDDGAEIHERLGTASKAITATQAAVSNYPSYAWQVVVAPVFIAIGASMLIFLWSELRTTFARRLILLAFLLFAVALGLDYLEGLENGYAWVSDYSDLNLKSLPHFSRSIEECIEMLATSLFLVVFLRHLDQHILAFRVEFDHETDS